MVSAMTHRLYVAAVAAVIVRGDRALALRRSQSRDVAPGLWEVCSGRIEADEQPRAAVAREIEEETGLSVCIEDRSIDAYVAQRGRDPMALIIYRATWVVGEPRLSDEHDLHAWWTLAEFRNGAVPQRLIVALRLALGSDA